jgi:hypothetical protein
VLIVLPAKAAQLALPAVPHYELLPPPTLSQPAAPPRYTEHNSGSQTAAGQEYNKGNQPKPFWEPFTGDPVAFATLLLTGVTAILAVSTVGLWIVTGIAGRRQSRDMQRSIRIAEQSLIAVERAFVFGKGFQIGYDLQDGILENYLFFTSIENIGNTPANDVRIWMKGQFFPMNENRDASFVADNPGAPTVLGPRSPPLQSGFAIVPLSVMQQNWRHETEIWIWSRVEYRDIFNSGILHHHEQCARVELIHEPSTIPPKDHPPYIQSIVYGPQNTTG